MSFQIIIIFKVLKTFPYIKYTLVLCRKTEFYTFHYIMPTLVIRWVGEEKSSNI